jgi:hypothetical protein
MKMVKIAVINKTFPGTRRNMMRRKEKFKRVTVSRVLRNHDS